ncbi:hypothetical protein D3C84_732990 [compost metagenome]
MDGVTAVFQRGAHQQIGAQVALCGRGRANHHVVVGQTGGQAVHVGFGDGRDRFDAQGSAGTHDAHSDFAAVGDQYPTDVAGCYGNAAHQRASGSIIINNWSR